MCEPNGKKGGTNVLGGGSDRSELRCCDGFSIVMSFMSIAALALPPEPLQPSGPGRVLIAVGPD